MANTYAKYFVCKIINYCLVLFLIATKLQQFKKTQNFEIAESEQ